MTMPIIGKSIFCLLALLIAVLPCCAEESALRPNVILILADDMAVGDLSCLNDDRSRTPHLDALKAESVWFQQAYSASAVCAPARAALLTGRYPHRTGVVSLNMEKYPELTQLHRDEVTMADVFRANGYSTGMIGKWHLGTGSDFHPLARGFDLFEGFIGHLYVPDYFNFRLDIQDQTQWFPGRYLTTDLSERAVRFVRDHRDEPFFLHLAHYAPHRPLGAPEERIEPFLQQGLDRETATVYAMIEIMDEGIGQLLKELEQLNIADRTIVIFASDNGPDPLVADRFNLDLRGTKYEIHEGGIRVPLMVRWQGHFLAAEQDEVVHFTDMLPTLMELCKLTTNRPLDLDGTSFASVLQGGTRQQAPARFWQWNRGIPDYTHNAAMRDGHWKLVRPYVTRNMINGPSSQPPQLFDLNSDPTESSDVAPQHMDRVQSMNARLESWTHSVERDRVTSSH